MTKIGDEIRFPGVCINKFYRLPVAFGQNNFIINVGRNAVSAIKVYEQKLLQTLTLKNPFFFTCPVTFDPSECIVYCVANHNMLMAWSFDAESLDNARKLQVQETIFCVIANENVRPIIVFSNGVVFAADYLFSNPKVSTSSIFGTDEELIWADAALQETTATIFLLTINKKENNYKLYNHILNYEEGYAVTSKRVWSISRADAVVKTWCLCQGLRHLMFVVIWSDGKVYLYSEESSESSYAFVIPNVKDAQCIAVDAIDNFHLAFVMSNKERKETTLDIWDVKYGVRKRRKILKKYLSLNVQLKVLQSTVFLPSDEDIILIPVEVEISNLAAAVGKCVPVQETNNITCYSWTTDGNVEPVLADDYKQIKFPLPLTANYLLNEIFSDIKVKEIRTMFDYLSESELVKMLQLVLRKQFNEKNTDESSGCGCLLEKHQILSIIFQVPYSDVFLQQHLCKLSFEEIITALNYLLNYFQGNQVYEDNIPVLTDLQIVNWIQMLIQSHFEEFLLSRDKKIINFLNVLQKSVLEKMKWHNENEEPIANYCILLKKKKKILPEKTSQGNSSMHSFYL